MLSFITDLLFYLLILDAVFMLLASRFWIFDLFINFVFQFLILGIVCLVLLFVQGAWLQAIILLCTMLYFARPLFRVRYARKSTTGVPQLTILHANLNAKNKNFELLIKEIHANKPTIIALNEVSSGWVDALRTACNDTYPFVIDLPDTRYRGMTVLSQIPIASHEVFQPTAESSPLIRLRLKDMPLTMYIAHPLPPMGKSWADQRDTFFEFLATDVKIVQGDVLVVGDLNTTFFSPLMLRLLRISGLTLDRTGFGWKPSWMYGTPIALPIDHVLYRGSMQMLNFQILGAIGSDHRPVLATFHYAG